LLTISESYNQTQSAAEVSTRCHHVVFLPSYDDMDVAVNDKYVNSSRTRI